MKTRGFTLLELIIVIIIVSILGLVMVTALPSSANKLPAQAQALINNLRYIQFAAISKDTSYRVNLSATGYDFTSANGLTNISHPASGSNTISLDGDVSLSWNNAVLPNNYIVFNYLGVPYSDAAMTTPLTSNAILTLTVGGSSMNVVVTAGTGFVTSS
jgi:prepilin-type N-terminal cleavage/methylation domain-containing protein